MGSENPKFVGRGHKGRRMPPEQRARVSEGLRRWHASMTPEEHEAYAQAQRDAHLPGMWTQNRRCVVTPFVKGHPDMSTEQGIEKMRDSKLARPSIKRHMVDIARDQPELIRETILRELAGPRAPAILLMFAAYLDGKPTDGQNQPEPQPWVAWLTDEELATVEGLIQRAQERMDRGEEPPTTSLVAIDEPPASDVIDIEAAEMVLDE
jgi:hypothetical protein